MGKFLEDLKAKVIHVFALKTMWHFVYTFFKKIFIVHFHTNNTIQINTKSAHRKILVFSHAIRLDWAHILPL